MNLAETRRSLDGAEVSLRQAADELIRFPLEPGRACAALERAGRAVTAVRGGSPKASRELAESCRRIRQEAALVSRLLDSAAVFSLGSAQAGHVVFQG